MSTPSDACIAAFERQYDTTWADPVLRNERLAWVASWKAASACQGCAVQQGYMPAQAVVQIQEPERNKPSMSMHVSVEDYQRALADWETEQSQLAAVQQGVQPWEYPFFSHDTEGGTEFHKTEAEAIKWCEEALQVYREEACDGWAEEVESLTWGVVLGRAVKCDEKPAPKGSEFDHLCDYSLQSVAHPTQQGLDAQRWQIVHNRINGEYIAGRAHFVVQLAPVPDTNIMRGSVAEHFTRAVDFAAAQAKQGEPKP